MLGGEGIQNTQLIWWGDTDQKLVLGAAFAEWRAPTPMEQSLPTAPHNHYQQTERKKEKNIKIRLQVKSYDFQAMLIFPLNL